MTTRSVTSACALVAAMPILKPAACAAAFAAMTTLRRSRRPMRTSGASAGGAVSASFRLRRSVGQVGRNSDTTLGIGASTSKSALSPARQRISSTSQRARPTPGTGSGAEGRTETRQRVVEAVGCPKSEASVCLRQRRIAIPIVPELSAASCNRREAVIERRASSPATTLRPP